jgi:circadian clock protein KaiB
MPNKKGTDSKRRLEQFAEKSRAAQYVLRLYVSGATPASTRAIANLRDICERRLKGSYQLEVIDIFQQPKLAEGEQIVAAPTLVKLLPPPIRRFIGDLSRLESKLLGLDIRPVEEPPGR